MINNDLRWKQRFMNFCKAYNLLSKFIQKGDLNEMEQQGLIHSFVFTYELSGYLLKDYYEDQGDANMQGSRDAFRLAFRRGLINDGENWMDMIESRKLSAHTYNEDTANLVLGKITNIYFDLFTALKNTFQILIEND